MRFIVPDGSTDKKKTTRTQRRELAYSQQAVWDAKRQHIEALRPFLPPPLQRLQELRIDDAHARHIVWDRVTRRLYLWLRHSNDEYGHFDLHLRFQDVDLSRRDAYTLRLIRRQGLQSDVRDWEVDLVPEVGLRPYIYQLQWHTRLEMWSEKDGVKLPKVYPSNRRRRWNVGEVTHTLSPEVELRFATLDLEITQVPPEQDLQAWRRRVPKSGWDYRKWVVERREERQER